MTKSPQIWHESEPTSPPLGPVRTRARPQADPRLATSQTPIANQPDTKQYEVGYGKPPVQTRFQLGCSGNRKGRPKGAKGLNTLVREGLLQKVTVRTAAGDKRLTRIEALIQKAVEQAMKGNPRALSELLRLYGNAVPEQTSKPLDTEELTAADHIILDALFEQMLKERGGGGDD